MVMSTRIEVKERPGLTKNSPSGEFCRHLLRGCGGMSEKVAHPRLLSGTRRHSWDKHTRLDTAKVAAKRLILAARLAMVDVPLGRGECHRRNTVAQKKGQRCCEDAC